MPRFIRGSHLSLSGSETPLPLVCLVPAGSGVVLLLLLSDPLSTSGGCHLSGRALRLRGLIRSCAQTDVGPASLISARIDLQLGNIFCRFPLLSWCSNFSIGTDICVWFNNAIKDGAASPGDRVHEDEASLVLLSGVLLLGAPRVGQRAAAVFGKLALIKHQRYAHAHQFKRANKALRKLKTYLGRVIRDLARRTSVDQELRQALAHPLSIARRVLEQDYRQRGRKIYSLLAPEVECVGEGKAHRPYEFGVKVSVATRLQRSRGGQFVAHIATLPGNPYDGHAGRDHPQHGGADRQQA